MTRLRRLTITTGGVNDRAHHHEMSVALLLLIPAMATAQTPRAPTPAANDQLLKPEQPTRHPGYARSITSVKLFAGIATESAMRSPHRSATTAMSAVSRTPQAGSCARRLASNAALLGAVCAPSRRNGP